MAPSGSRPETESIVLRPFLAPERGVRPNESAIPMPRRYPSESSAMWPSSDSSANMAAVASLAPTVATSEIVSTMSASLNPSDDAPTRHWMLNAVLLIDTGGNLCEIAITIDLTSVNKKNDLLRERWDETQNIRAMP